MKKILITALFAALTTMGMTALSLDSLRIDGRVGFALGGTLPVHIDNTIRSINNFNPGINYSFASEVTLPFNRHWALHMGLRFERNSMDVDSRVKNYDMEVTRGGESLTGVFMGNVRVKSRQHRFTMPVQAAYIFNGKWTVRGGAFLAVLTDHKFWGWAYDGYLREGTPVGAKVDMGTEPGERGDFDFNNRLRNLQWGLDLGADWQFHKHWGAFVDVTYGLNGIFKSDFHTIDTTRPVFGTIGVLYRIK